MDVQHVCSQSNGTVIYVSILLVKPHIDTKRVIVTTIVELSAIYED